MNFWESKTRPQECLDSVQFTLIRFYSQTAFYRHCHRYAFQRKQKGQKQTWTPHERTSEVKINTFKKNLQTTEPLCPGTVSAHVYLHALACVRAYVGVFGCTYAVCMHLCDHVLFCMCASADRGLCQALTTASLMPAFLWPLHTQRSPSTVWVSMASHHGAEKEQVWYGQMKMTKWYVFIYWDIPNYDIIN